MTTPWKANRDKKMAELGQDAPAEQPKAAAKKRKKKKKAG